MPKPSGTVELPLEQLDRVTTWWQAKAKHLSSVAEAVQALVNEALVKEGYPPPAPK